ncbi:ubiquitin specific peptidase 8, putative [Ichthyophthirius multifiliis]|uniref:ubiquitinyl hydrolase 1 n=1 Tax=Ichthyophthirius multifiliis TaxID=5932 RepID=G0QTS1_ICHMU|nr:ubiquitin specific peptidase 8, putative [Ichthyophthirius multifiliis]EGR31392.1 ubiquitin specific peptidase 8, putative [Ichthyophthirius multifiliis]|eukprot:XP_004034878.1 ubiquitin specific peptidase 8, putative [Ichthyophthirius multifiliis]
MDIEDLEEDTQNSELIQYYDIIKKFNIKPVVKNYINQKGLTGLLNLTNTCFLNSAIQCLSNIEKLTFYMISNQFIKDLNINNPLGTKGQLAVSYSNLIKQIWQGTEPYVSPIQIKKIIEKKNKKIHCQFSGFNQQDSQELLNFILDGLHEDLNRIKNKPIIENIEYQGGNDELYAERFFMNYKQRNDSIICDLMLGQFKSTLMCPDCRKISITFDPYMTISVPVPQIRQINLSLQWNCQNTFSIYDCINEFVQEEILQKGNEWYCNICGEHKLAKKKIEIYQTPEILILHLKRFKVGTVNKYGGKYFVEQEGKKITSLVDFPIENLNLEDFVLNKKQISNVYNLFAVSQHLGEAAGGHYTTMALNFLNQKWYEYNDQNVLQKKNIEVKNQAYILFYKRK